MPRRRLCADLIRCALTVSLLTLGLLATGPAASAGTAPRRIVNGWLPSWSMPASLASVTRNAALWGEASPYWYRATGATTIAEQPGAGDASVVEALRGRGIKVVPTVTGSLSAAGMAVLLSDPVQRAAHARALAGLVTANGYDGIDLDYESMNFGGTTTDRTAVRRGFVRLLGELGAALDAQGKLLSVTVGARTSAADRSWAVHDYAGIASSVDRFRIMAYDYHSTGGSPGAVAPLWWVDKVLAYALTAVPASRIELGVPLYGYDWAADPTRSGGYGKAVGRTYAQAEAIRAQYSATRQWSSVDAAPHFTYTTAQGVRHVVWYNDVDSTKAKMAFVAKYHLKGLAFWAVGHADARQWAALRSYALGDSDLP